MESRFTIMELGKPTVRLADNNPLQWPWQAGYDQFREYFEKLGLGKCGHCRIGTYYACKDGPVLRYDLIKDYPRIWD